MHIYKNQKLGSTDEKIVFQPLHVHSGMQASIVTHVTDTYAQNNNNNNLKIRKVLVGEKKILDFSGSSISQV